MNEVQEEYVKEMGERKGTLPFFVLICSPAQNHQLHKA